MNQTWDPNQRRLLCSLKYVHLFHSPHAYSHNTLDKFNFYLFSNYFPFGVAAYDRRTLMIIRRQISSQRLRVPLAVRFANRELDGGPAAVNPNPKGSYSNQYLATLLPGG